MCIRDRVRSTRGKRQQLLLPMETRQATVIGDVEDHNPWAPLAAQAAVADLHKVEQVTTAADQQ
eukprot:3527621-Prorocentrum_lima.AAC.1